MAFPTAPVRPGQEVELEIRSLGHAGEGVGRHRDFTLFVPGGLPGDRLRVQVTEVKATYGRARLLAVLAPAPGRVAPPCPVFGACGGCQLQHLDYAAQLAGKRQQVEDALVRIGKLIGVTVHPTLGMADPWHYRNKAQFPVGLDGGRLVAGPYAPGTHRVVDVDACLIQHPVANQVLQAVKALAVRHSVPVYQETTRTGVLRHVLVRVSRHSGEAMAVLVTATRALPRAGALVRELQAAVPALASVWQNVNPRPTNVVLGEENIHLAGRRTLEDTIGGLRFHLSPASFYQVNPQQTEVLYRQALAYAGLSGGETVIDAYCGVGTISLFLARQAARVYGVEVVPAAMADARVNAAANGIANAEFLLGEAEDVLPRLQRQGVRPDVIVFDPPRKGCGEAALAAAAAMAPARMVYVSCNPTTLARDLALLRERGYRTLEVQPVDMFPHTAHVECCSLLVRQKD